MSTIVPRIYNVNVAGNPEKAAEIHTELTETVGTRPASVDLRGQCPKIYDQGQLGSCTGHASAKGLREIIARVYGHPIPEMSALFGYWNARSAEHTVDQDAGATLCDVAAVLLHEGACPEYLDPYLINQFKVAPTVEAFAAAKDFKLKQVTHLRSLDAILDCLAAGFPVMGGIPVFDGEAGLEGNTAYQSGIVGMPAPGDKIVGGHAIVIVGYGMASQTLLVRNSWSSEWGDNGYFHMPMAYVETYAPPASSDWWTGR